MNKRQLTTKEFKEKIKEITAQSDWRKAEIYKAHAERLAEALRGFLVDGNHSEIVQQGESVLAQWEATQK